MSATASVNGGAPRSYYGQPVIKEPIWKPEIPWYLFSGGLGGASAGLAYLADRTGNDVLARRAWLASVGGVGASAVLLISDLGVPRRFLNMLRMFKVTSPMSVGSWILTGTGAATGVAALHEVTGAFPRLAMVARPVAAGLGLPLSTYTAALLAQTAVPVWHEAHRELPVIFAAGAAASAGAMAAMVTPVDHAGPARRLTVMGSVVELAAVQFMEHRLADLADPYQSPDAEPFTRAARLLTATGGLLLAGAARRRRAAAVAGGALVLGGALCERWSVFKAGLVSARDPKYTVGPQRDRVRTGRGLGAIRRAVAGGHASARVAE